MISPMWTVQCGQTRDRDIPRHHHHSTLPPWCLPGGRVPGVGWGGGYLELRPQLGAPKMAPTTATVADTRIV